MPQPISDKLYHAMLKAAANCGYLQRGPGAGLDVFIPLENRRWAALDRMAVSLPRGGFRREIMGAALTQLGRTILRDEVERRGDPMPTALQPPTPTPPAASTYQQLAFTFAS